MEPNVITNSCKGGVFDWIRDLGVKCKEMGLKNASNTFYSKSTAMSTKRSAEKSHFGLKIQAGGWL
jgi:hypothetical protein